MAPNELEILLLAARGSRYKPSADHNRDRDHLTNYSLCMYLASKSVL